MDLSIVIVNYNTRELLASCIHSLVKHISQVAYEIIIVDNASTDNSIRRVKALAEKYPLKFIRNKDNLGFGRANNKGIAIAKGRYVLLLNSDTVIEKNIFPEMLDWMDENRNIGVLSCTLLNPDHTNQGTGGSFPTLFRVFNWMFFIEDLPLIDRLIKPFHPVHGNSPFYKGSTGGTQVELDRDWVTGAFMLIRSKVLSQVGAFDPDYFMYTEEVDLCFRIKKAGYLIAYNPRWAIVHLGGASSGSEFALLSEFKGLKIFYKKNMPIWQYPVLRLFLKCGAFLRMFIYFAIKGPKGFKIYAKAFSTI